MEKNEDKKKIKIKLSTFIIMCIIFLVVLFLGIGIFIPKITNKINNPISTTNPIERTELKKIIKTFTIRLPAKLASSEYGTDIEYDFINKTKTVINYTSGTWNNNKEAVEYDRFDELFDYLYNTVFPNNEDLKDSSTNNYGVVYAQPKSEFDMYVEFNTVEKVPSFSNDWYSYQNSKTGLASWTLNAYKYPSYWNKFVKLLEIDK